jgi:hypothetical protein
MLSNVVQICTSSLRFLLTIENLYIKGEPKSPLPWTWNDHYNTEWLDLLRPFAAVKNLYLFNLFSTRLELVLQELTGERTTEVFPALRNVFLEDFLPSARQLTSHPVAISVWVRPVVGRGLRAWAIIRHYL